MQNKTGKEKLYKYFNIKENMISCKYETRVELDINVYKINDEELSNVEEAIEDDDLNYVYNIVGIFEAFIPEFNDTVQFSFPYKIELNKTENTVIKNNIINIIYEEGDPILFAITKDTGTDLSVITKQLDNSIKYLHGNIGKTVELLWEELTKNSSLKFHHAELIYTILYGEETAAGFIPVRLGSQKYISENAISSKESAHSFGTTNALNFGYSNEAILKNVIRKPGTEPQKSDLEKIISAEYHKLNNEKEY